MNHLSISLLGPLRVTLQNGKPAQFEADTARALLAYLATHAEAPQRRETLAGLLWPEQPESRALANLRQALNRLRGSIGDRDAHPPLLRVSRKSIQFNPAITSSKVIAPSKVSDYWLDVAAFSAAIAASQEHRHRRLETCRSCMQKLAEAVEVYRGDFLAGFSLPSAPFEEWLLVQRERLQRQALEALGCLAAYHERRGEWEQAGRYARRQVELEPWRESAQRGLMRALALNGERTAALAQYEICRQTLAEELGVEPEDETTALYERIREGSELEALSPLPPCNLPTYLTPFVGREAVLAEIEERLADPDCRLLSLIGPGGSGKTRLAVEVGAAQAAAFEHGVFFARLSPLQSVEAIVPTVARALGFSFYTSEGDARQVEPRQQLLDYVRQKSILLIMDNFEHLLDGVDLVTDVLKMAPDVSVLATSRARLNVQGEQLFPVAGMDVPDEEMLKEAAQYSAVKLFLSSARRAQPGFELTTDNLADVARICRLAQGMPLGILLAAGWVDMLTPTEIATEISQGLDFLETDLRDVPERQRSMRAVFDHSWRLLTEREREVLEGLSVFRGGFTRQAAQEITGASLRELMALVNKSLLHRTPTGRHEIHGLLRRYAAEKLDESPAYGKAICDRHGAYYVAALQKWAADLKDPRRRATWVGMDTEIENARVAWNWAVEREQVERLEQAMEGLCRFYELRGRYDEALEAYEEARHLLAQRGAPTVVAKLYRKIAVIYERKANYPLALEWLERGLKVLDDRQVTETARIYNLGSGVFYRQGEREKALEWRQRALQIAERLEDQNEVANAYLVMAIIYSDWAETERALDFGRRCLEAYEAVGDLVGSVKARNNLGSISRKAGDWGQAAEHCREGLRLSEMMGDVMNIGMFANNMGNIYFNQGKLQDAAAAYRRSVAVWQPIGFLAGMVVAHINLSRVVIVQGDLEAGETYLADALTLTQEIGARDYLPEIYHWQARIRIARSQYKEALSLADRAYNLARELKNWAAGGRILRALGQIYAALGQTEKAIDYLDASLVCFAGLENTYQMIQTCFHIALVYLKKPDKRAEGRALLNQARAIFAELGAQWDLAQVEKVYEQELLVESKGEQIPQPFARQPVSEPDGLGKGRVASTHQPTVAVTDCKVSFIANRFEISDPEKDLLGGGETGRVYRGTDTQTGQAVSIKALKPEILASQPDMVARFVREGQALRQLDHPNIVKMVDAVQEDGQHYIVMEYVAGGSLRELLDAQRPDRFSSNLSGLPIARAVKIALELADALGRAHHLGIIHRDLKPANVLLAEDGTPRLTDFGHALLAASPRLTRSGALLGSVGYLSPEACNGETLDNRSDVWALGVLLYEMLTGELPFVGESLIAAITAILTQPVPDLASLRPDAPDALVDLVRRMLEKERQRRVPSARQVGAELEAILRGASGE